MDELVISIVVAGCTYLVWVVGRALREKRGRERYGADFVVAHHAVPEGVHHSHVPHLANDVIPDGSFRSQDHGGHDSHVAACLESVEVGESNVDDSSCDFRDFDADFDDD